MAACKIALAVALVMSANLAQVSGIRNIIIGAKNFFFFFISKTLSGPSDRDSFLSRSLLLFYLFIYIFLFSSKNARFDGL